MNQPAHAITDLHAELMSRHPVKDRRRQAREALEYTLRDLERRAEMVATMRRNHAAWLEEWRYRYRKDPDTRIPPLVFWIQDEDWMEAPPRRPGPRQACATCLGTQMKWVGPEGIAEVRPEHYVPCPACVEKRRAG